MTNDPNADITLLHSPVPGVVYVDDAFIPIMQVLLPLCILMAYVPMVYNMVFKIVQEKESRTKEIMRIMGMNDFPYWLSWLIFYTMINTIVATLSWCILTIRVVNYS